MNTPTAPQSLATAAALITAELRDKRRRFTRALVAAARA